MMEAVRRKELTDPPEWERLRVSFLCELELPLRGGEETLSSMLFGMLLSFCNGSMPHYPIKKILLLIWKFILTVMGGVSQLEEIKKSARVAADLPPTFPEKPPSKPLLLPMPNYDPRYSILVRIFQ